MDDEKFKVIEEDDTVIFDESDDYVTGESLMCDDDELDMDYLLNQTRIQETQAKAEQKRQHWISFGVIAAIVGFIISVCYYAFRGVLF